MKNTVRLSQWALIILMAMAFYTCKKAESPNPTLSGPPSIQQPQVQNPYTPPAITFKAQVMGFVADINGQPVQGANVTANGQSTTTDNFGVFILDNAPFTGDFCYIKVEKQGYFIGSNTVHGEAGAKLLTEITLQPKNDVFTYAASDAKEIALSNGSKINFPANAVKKADGSTYTGNVHVAIAPIHPDDKNFSKLIPGGDLRAYTLTGENVKLYSLGMLNVELYDDAGNKLQLADGKEATLTFPISASQLNEASATIPLWYFDEDKGVWIEEGQAIKQGNTYVGTVKHFTPWNCDKPYNSGGLKGQLMDCFGQPIIRRDIIVGQDRCYTDSRGYFRATVTGGEALAIKVFNKEKNEFVVIKNIPEGAPAGKETDIGVIEDVSSCSKAIAKVTDCSNKPFSGYAIFSDNGNLNGAIVPVINGDFAISNKLNSGKVEIVFYSPHTQALFEHTTDIVSAPVVNLGTIRVCPENAGANKVGFSFTYTDGEITKTYEIKKPDLAIASYSTSKNLTTVTFLSSTSPADNISISFNGKLQGSFGNTDTKKPAVNMDLKSQALGVKSYTDNVSVTAYGDVGQEIKGTFKGRYLFSDNKWIVPKAMMITQGNFTAVRLPDVQ